MGRQDFAEAEIEVDDEEEDVEDAIGDFLKMEISVPCLCLRFILFLVEDVEDEVGPDGVEKTGL